MKEWLNKGKKLDEKINFFILYWGSRMLPKKYWAMKKNFINKDKYETKREGNNWFDDINF